MLTTFKQREGIVLRQIRIPVPARARPNAPAGPVGAIELADAGAWQRTESARELGPSIDVAPDARHSSRVVICQLDAMLA